MCPGMVISPFAEWEMEGMCALPIWMVCLQVTKHNEKLMLSYTQIFYSDEQAQHILSHRVSLADCTFKG